MSELLDAIAARINAATEGPWYTDEHGYGVGVSYIDGWADDLQLFVETNGLTYTPNPADAEFIAHSRSDLPRLLAAVRAVEAVHEPIDALNVRINRIQKVCTGCGTDGGNWQVWPCPTIRAITGALEGEG